MTKLRTLLPLCFLLFVCSAVRAAEKHDVSGQVFDQENQAVPFANVLLFNSVDSSLAATALTDTAGTFFIDVAEPKGQYRLIIESVGIGTFTKEELSLPVDLGKVIVQQEAVTLEQVSIVTKKQLFEKTGRGMVVNVSSSPVMEGANTKEVLSKIPSVTVNQDGTLNLKGRSDLQIFMDGKPANMSMDDLLRLLETMPSSDIEKIEVFEIPPAKYEASGTGGIINIVTKKGSRLGFNGNASARGGYGNYHKLNTSLSGNYRTEKVNVFASGWYYNSMFDHRATADMLMEIDGDTSSFFNDFHRNHHAIGFGSRYGIDLFATEKTTVGYLGLYYNGGTFGWEPSTVTVKGPQAANYDFIDAMELFDYYWSGHTHNINVSRKIKDREQLNFDVDFALRKNGRDNSNLNEYSANGTALTPFYIEQKGQTSSQIAATQIDYEKGLKSGWDIETGAKGSYVKTDNGFNAFEGTSSQDATENTAAANTFTYEEMIAAAYGTAAKKWNERWNMDVGFRVEYTLAKGLSPTTSADFTKSYLNFFPNVSLAYSKGDKYSISTAVTRRINRPKYYQLNPFQSQTNQFNFHQGNPDLDPQYTNTANITYGLRNAFFLTLSASQTYGLMNQVIDQQEDLQRQVHTTENLDRFENYSINAYIPFKLNKFYSGNFNVTAFHNRMASDLNWGVVGYEVSTFSIQSQHIFNLPKKFSAEISGFYNHDSYWNIWFVKPHYQIDFALSKKYLNWKFNLAINDFLNIREGIGGVFQGDVNMATTYKPESRKVFLNVSYRFGNDKVKASRRRKTASEDLQNRASD